MLLRYALQLETEARAARGRGLRGHRRAARCPPISPRGAARTTRAADDAVPAGSTSGCVAGATRRSGALQTGAKIRDQIRGILDADRHPQQSRARCPRVSRADSSMPACVMLAGMRDQALDAAQGFGEREALEAGRETRRPRPRRRRARSSASRRSRFAGGARSHGRDDPAAPDRTPARTAGWPLEQARPPPRCSRHAPACARAGCARRASVRKLSNGAPVTPMALAHQARLSAARESRRSPRRRPRRCGRSGTWWSNA